MYLAWFYIAWTLRIEHKPKCICPCLSSHNRIFQICYPTDFDFNHNLSPENPCCLPNISHILGSLITYLKNSLMVKWPAERLKVSPACSWHIPLFLKPARSGSPSGSLRTKEFRPSDLPFPEFSLTLYQKHKSSLYAAFSASKTS